MRTHFENKWRWAESKVLLCLARVGAEDRFVYYWGSREFGGMSLDQVAAITKIPRESCRKVIGRLLRYQMVGRFETAVWDRPGWVYFPRIDVMDYLRQSNRVDIPKLEAMLDWGDEA